MALTKYLRTARFTLALLGGGGACTWALASGCGASHADAGMRDAATLTSADAPYGGYDAGRDSAADATADTGAPEPWDGGLGCTEQPGWQVIHPLYPNCTAQLAPPNLMANAALPMRPCSNGQVGCDELVLPPTPPNRSRYFTVSPIGTEATGFLLDYESDPIYEPCRRSTYIVPNVSGYTVGGAADTDLQRCMVVGANGKLGFAESRRFGHPALAGLTTWAGDGGMLATWQPARTEFPELWTSGTTAFTFQNSSSNVDVVDAVSAAPLSSTHPPASIRQWFPDFSVYDELWGSANYGALGKTELWKVGRDGVFVAMRQKQGVHIFAPQSDGVTLFWVEGSGNDADFFPQPKLEIWSAPLSSDPNAIAQGAHRIVDVSGVTEVRFGVAHSGYYAATLGSSEFAVIRARDGAFQRISLTGGWGAVDLAYVDEHQLWFGHGAIDARQSGVARIMLNPWP